MSDFPQSSLCGITQQASDNIQKPQLTDQQRKLVEDNYQQIKKLLINMIRSYRGGKMIKVRSNTDKILDGLSYSVEAAMKFDPSITPVDKFAKYAAYTCFFRLIDQSRRTNKHNLVGLVKKGVVNRLMEQSLQEFGFFNEEFVHNQLIKNNLDSKEIHKADIIKKMDVSRFENSNEIITKNELSDLDIEEKFKLFKAKSDLYFVNTGCKLTRIRKTLVDEHILPRLQGKDYKTLTQISKENNGISVGRLAQILRDDNIKNFLTICYGDKDKNGVPIIK